MSAHLSLSKFILSILAFSALIPVLAFTQDTYQGIESDHTAANRHGLYEIREEAKQFVKKQNEMHHAHLEVLDPNLKISVPRCTVPLETMWRPKDRGASKGVWVICKQSVDKDYKKWNVFVPVAMLKDGKYR